MANSLLRSACALVLLVSPAALQGARGEWETPALETETVSLYVTVLDESGAPITGLARDDFHLLENGSPRPLEHFAEVGPGSRGEPREPRWLVFTFSEELDFRELFRAKRAALRLADRLDRQDSVAVLRGSRLSPFEREAEVYRSSIRYFGLEDGWRDRGEWQRRPGWFATGQAEGEEGELGRRLRWLISKGAEGMPAELLGSLKHLAGRMVLIYFGAAPPADDGEQALPPLELADAGFTVFAVDPAAGPDAAGFGALQSWAARSGGEAVRLEGPPEEALAPVLQRLASAYRLRFTPDPLQDCRFRRLEVAVRRAGAARVLGRSGYFATGPAALSLAERTFQTVLREPERFRDFPLNLAGRLQPAEEEPEAASVQLRLAFPLAGVRLDPGSEGRWRQRLILFVGVFDRAGRRIGGVRRLLSVSAAEADLDSVMQQTATLDETVRLRPDERPAVVRAIVVAGENRQIAFQEFEMP